MRQLNDRLSSRSEAALSRHFIMPHSGELLALAGLVVFQWSLVDGANGSELPAMNALSAVVLMVVLVIGAYRMVRRDTRNLLNILFWFRLSTTTFFGFGTFAIYIMNDTTLLSVKALYAFNEQQVAKLNLIVATSTFVVLALAAVTLYLISKPLRATRPSTFANRQLMTLGLFFFLLAAGVDILIRIPFALGESQVAPSGFINALSKIGPVGFFMIAVAAFSSHRRVLVALMVILLAGEIVLALVLFHKQSLILYAIMFGAAWLWVRISALRVAVVFVGIAALLPMSYDIVSSARIAALQTHGAMDGLPMAERLQILSDYWTRGDSSREFSERQGYLSRLSYVNAASFVIEQNDIGLPGRTLKKSIYVFIPRVLWPDKPTISGVGNDVYFLLTSSDSASFGVGWFAHAYWDFGWWGVLGLMACIGIVFGICADYSWRVLVASNWMRFPVVLLLARVGMRTDGDLLTDVFGQAPLILAVLIVLRIFESLIASPLR